MRTSKRITSEDVARAAGVSRTTVSFVLNDRPGQSIAEGTRLRVLDAARRLDYRPHASARALAAGRSDIALLCVPDVPIGASVSRFIEELAGALANQGMTLVTHLEGAYARLLPDVCATVNASVVIGFEAFGHDTVQALHRAGAVVVIPSDADIADAGEPIGRLQAEHLISRGHRRIGYAMPTDPGLRPMAEERCRGITDACVDAGLAPPVMLSTELEMPDAARAVALWAERSVTGICAFNDETAIAVLAGAREHGLAVPGDMAVIGADDIPTARLTAPPLTTVSLNLREVSRRRAEAAVAALSDLGPPPAVATEFSRVVQRSST